MLYHNSVAMKPSNVTLESKAITSNISDLSLASLLIKPTEGGLLLNNLSSGVEYEKHVTQSECMYPSFSLCSGHSYVAYLAPNSVGANLANIPKIIENIP